MTNGNAMNGDGHAYSWRKDVDVGATKELLHSINQPQSLEANRANLISSSVGGIDGLAKLLETDVDKGILVSSEEAIDAEVESRRHAFGSNSLPFSPRKSFWQLFVDTFDDGTLQILIASAIVSLAVGLYDDPATGYVEGLAILSAILLVSVVTAVNDDQKERQFRALSAADDAGTVVVVRGGKAISVPTEELVVGDLVCLEAGDKIPCDGVLVAADGCGADESALTGEPETTAKDCLSASSDGSSDPFLLSGCILESGSARFLAVAVGRESQWGVIKSKLEKEQEQTPLQEKLDDMAEVIGHVGMAAAAATFIAMMFLKVYVKPQYLEDVSVFAHALDAFIIGVSLVVAAVPEGLPLAVTIALAFSTKKMLADNNLIRHLQACETMGNATNICSDKTGTLTENRMTVVEGVLGNEALTFDASSKALPPTRLQPAAKEILLQCIGTCSTARVLKDKATNLPLVVGNKTEASLLMLARSEWGGNDDFERRRADACFGKPGGSRLFPFSSSRKRMSVLVADGTNWTLYHKGAAESVLADCTTYLDVDGSQKPLTDNIRKTYEQLIRSYASRALRCLCLSHRTISSDDVTNIADVGSLENALCLDGLVGIADPLRADVVEAVATCQSAGIVVRMVTGDNIDTAKAIAKEAGILTEGAISMEGETFRKLTPAALDQILPNLRVLARSSPEDKHILVQRLNGGLMPKNEAEWTDAHPGKSFVKDKDLLLPGYYDEWALSRNGVGEVVGVTGDGTNDGPALKAADVGLSMGLSGTDVAKNASDIVIMDDNFSSIVKAVLWGRSVYDNIRKFLQFQLTVNVVALTITFLSAVAGYKPPLNAVMMLWVNMIMDTMGALALGTEPPDPDLLRRPPYTRDSSLISRPMWRNILVQAIYQLGLLIFLLQKGPQTFGCIDGSRHHFTILFNAFVMCQIFNEFNAREIGDRFAPFANLGRSPMFLGVVVFTVLAQWAIVEYGGDFTQTYPLSAAEWQVTSLLGAMSIPVGYLMRQIPVAEDPESFATPAGVVGAADGKTNKGSSKTYLKFFLPVIAAVGYQIYISYYS